MAGIVKTTTGLTGLAVARHPHQSLRVVYEKILRTLQKIPVEAGYRKHTEKIVNHRLHLVKTEPDVIRLEEKMNSGQVEELLLQADRELALARRMIKWKAWEPLIATAPPKQWQWPVV